MRNAVLALLAATCVLSQANAQTKVAPDKEAAMKADLTGQIDAMKKQAQVMVDSVFSFGELGFQEFETTKYLTGILEKAGFQIERGVAGVPTAWVATWGSGKPVISLGSDIDDIPQASQKPGVAWHEPMIEGRGTGRHQGLLRPRGTVQERGRLPVHPRRQQPGRVLGPGPQSERLGLDRIHVQGRERPRGRRALARP
jgi:aminobenzoyl-glutamate utilization protein B